MTNFERHIDLMSCHTALDHALEELAATKVSLADTAASLLNSVRDTVKAQHQHEKAQAALKRVGAVVATIHLLASAAAGDAAGQDHAGGRLRRGAEAYADAYENAERLLLAALVDLDGEVIRVLGGEQMDAESQAYFAEIVRAAKRRAAVDGYPIQTAMFEERPKYDPEAP